MTMMLSVIAVFVLLLDLLALDDITTGRQPSFALEYSMLALSVVYFAALGWLLTRRRRTADTN